MGELSGMKTGNFSSRSFSSFARRIPLAQRFRSAISAAVKERVRLGDIGVK
ncbi:MAG: hypothetical protein R3F11_26910 [Verrucomicrobiales bacterium]